MQTAFEALGSVAFLDNLTDAIVIVDGDWSLCYANAGAEIFLGRARAQLLGGAIWDVLPRAIGADHADDYRRARETGNAATFELCLLAAGQHLTVGVYPTATQLAIVIRDTTDRQLLAHSLLDSEAQRHALTVRVDRQQREIALLDRLRHSLTHLLDERTIVRAVVAIVADERKYPQMSVGLLRDDELVGEAHVGLAHRPLSISISQGMMGRIARNRRAEFIADVTTDPDYLGDPDAQGEAICIPLLDDDQLLGVLNVESAGRTTLNEDDFRLLSMLAEQVGVALGRARRHAALHLNESRLRAQYQTFPLPTYTWEHRDGDFMLLDFNAAAEEFTDGKIADILGQSASAIYATLPQVREALDRCYVEQTTVRHDLHYHSPLLDKLLHLIVTYLYVAPHFIVMHVEDVTRRTAIEAALRASEARLKALMLHDRDVTIIVAADGTLRYVSPAVERVLGYPPDFPPGTNAFDWVHPEDRAAAERYLRDVAATPGAAHAHELRLRHRDGSWRWVETSATNLFADPDIAGLVISYRDIGGRRASEQELRERDERFRLLARATNDAVWDWDLTTDTLWWNEGIETLFGYPQATVGPGIDWWEEQIHPDDRDRVATGIHAAIDGGAATWQDEYRFARVDGSYALVYDRGFIVRDEPHAHARMLGSMQDISARKDAEAALRASEADLAAAQALAHLGSWEYDHTSGEMRWSDECFRIGGYAPRSFVPTPQRMLAFVHPDDRELVRAALGISLERGEPFALDHRIIRLDGEVRIVHQQTDSVKDADGRLLKRHGIVQDVTERRQLEAQLLHQAFHDPLTGLPNRALFLDRLGHALDRARRDQQHCAVLLLDMDRFKNVNDSLGHGSGDRLLVALSARLRVNLRDVDTLARLGGDEFAILLEDIADIGEALRTAERLHAALQIPLSVGDREMYAPVSIGIALRSDSDETTADLLRFADVALYRAKERGGECTEIFYPSMDVQALEQFDLERDLRRAIERHELRVYYQPIIDLATGRIAGLEALLRWQHPTRGLVAPNDFIPLAEKTGLIVPIGGWVLTAACRQMRAWHEDYPTATLPLLSVNLSARQFRHPDLARDVAASLAATGLAPEHLVIEVTETVAMDHAESAIATLERLKQLGVAIAIDDFGTGYSSLAYLQRLPVDTLKIDRAFFLDFERNRAIIRAVATLAQGLGLAVVAEGLETADQVRWASEAGCDRGQGYYFAPALPADRLETLWQTGLTFALPDPEPAPTTTSLPQATNAR